MLHPKPRQPGCSEIPEMVPCVVKREKTLVRIDNPDDSQRSRQQSSGSRQRVVRCNFRKQKDLRTADDSDDSDD